MIRSMEEPESRCSRDYAGAFTLVQITVGQSCVCALLVTKLLMRKKQRRSVRSFMNEDKEFRQENEMIPQNPPAQYGEEAGTAEYKKAGAAVEPVSAADVNMRKAEAYRASREEEASGRRSSPLRIIKNAAALIACAAIFGIMAAAVFQGVSWFNSGEEGRNGSAVASGTIDEMDTSYGEEEDNKQEETGGLLQTSAEKTTVADVSEVVENVMPAVVAINCNIETSSTVYDFFGRGHESKQQETSSGTGIIIGQSDREVLIVTNNHVIENAVKVEIVFCDGTAVQAAVKGTESENDLAVVAVNLGDLPGTVMNAIRIATLGNSDSARMGEMVIAIGNALGYGQSVTVGYISALAREVTVDDVTLNLIQVDAAINPGNSGGALLNANGEVIGINSVKYSSTDVEGIGYAIPISEVIPIINELMNREKLDESETAYLGITGINIDTTYSNSFKMPVGIYVSKVGEGTPAETAGLHAGDIIVGINGRTLSTMEDLQKVLGYTRGGTEASLQIKVLENGNYVDKELKVVLGYRPQQSQ